MNLKINILGTEYTILELSEHQDEMLKRCDGYCDKTSKKIVVATKSSDCQLDDFEPYRKKCLRHEIIHAFLFESGLHENMKHPEYGHDEEMIDWVAAQFPKMLKVFKEVGCL